MAVASTLGPEQRGRGQSGPDLALRPPVVATDSLAQLDAYDPPDVLAGTPWHERLVCLGALRAGQARWPGPGEISVFFSVRLAGAQAFLLDRLATSFSG